MPSNDFAAVPRTVIGDNSGANYKFGVE